MSVAAGSFGNRHRSDFNSSETLTRPEFPELYALYSAALHRLAAASARSQTEADDICQEIWLRVHRELNTVEDPAATSSWLFTIARRVCIDAARRRCRSSQAMDEEAALINKPSSTLDQPEIRAASLEEVSLRWEALAWLPERQQTILLMRELSAASYEELAEHSAASVSAVEALLHRARKSLAKSYRSIAECPNERCRRVMETRAQLGTPEETPIRKLAVTRHLALCPRCRSGRAQRGTIAAWFGALGRSVGELAARLAVPAATVSSAAPFVAGTVLLMLAPTAPPMEGLTQPDSVVSAVATVRTTEPVAAPNLPPPAMIQPTVRPDPAAIPKIDSSAPVVPTSTPSKTAVPEWNPGASSPTTPASEPPVLPQTATRENASAPAPQTKTVPSPVASAEADYPAANPDAPTPTPSAPQIPPSSVQVEIPPVWVPILPALLPDWIPPLDDVYEVLDPTLNSVVEVLPPELRPDIDLPTVDEGGSITIPVPEAGADLPLLPELPVLPDVPVVPEILEEGESPIGDDGILDHLLPELLPHLP